MLIRKTFIDLLIRKAVKLWHEQLRFFPPIFREGNVVLNNSLVSCNQSHYTYLHMYNELDCNIKGGNV